MPAPRSSSSLLLLVLMLPAVAGCVDPVAPAPPEPAAPLEATPDRPSFTSTQGREFDLISDPQDPQHLTLAFVIPRNDPNFSSWLAIAKSRDGGATWTVRPFCGDPLRQPQTSDIGCPFLGARLTSDPVLLQLADGTILYVGVMLNADSVVQFAARFGRHDLTPASVHVVSRSAFDFFPGAHALPAPYRVYYNGKANVMQAQDGSLHLVWAANLVPHESRPAVGLPFWTTSRDGGRTWSTPVGLSEDEFGDPDALYAVGVQAFQTLDGRLHAIWWESKTNALYQVTATGAASFTPPKRIAAAVARPPNAPVNSDNLTRPWVVVDPTSGAFQGRTYLLFDDLSTGDRDLYLLVSDDHASAWSPASRIDTIPLRNGRDETMARLLLEPSGALSILYPSWQKLERWSPYEMRFARSTDGGATFHDILLSSDFSPLHNPGDYNGLAMTVEGILCVWEDGRGGPAGTKWAWQSLVRAADHSGKGL